MKIIYIIFFMFLNLITVAQAQWEKVGSGLNSYGTSRYLVNYDIEDNLVIFNYQFRIYFSNDKGLTFNYASYLTDKFDTGTDWFWSVKVHKGILYAGHSSKGLFYSLDTAKTWIKMSGKTEFYDKFINEILGIEFDKYDNIWVATYHGGPYYSTNKGATWIKPDTAKNNPLTKINPMTDIIIQDSVVYVYTINRDGIIRSTNLGVTWSTYNNNIPKYKTGGELKLINGEIYTSIFGANIDVRAGWIKYMKLNKENDNWEDYWIVGTPDSTIKAPIDFTICGEIIYHLDVFHDKGITYSIDSGKTFKYLNYGLEDYINWYFSSSFEYDHRCTLFRSLFTDGEYLYLNTCKDNDQFSRLYRLKLENCLPVLTSAEEVIKSDPPFPNPALNQLNLSLPDGALIEHYEVYNAVGEKVAEGRELNEGALDVSALPAGVYYIRCMTNEGMVNQKFVVRR